MYPKSYCQGDACGLGERRIQCAYGFHNTQPSTDGAMSVIFMGVGVAKIDKQPVTEQLSDMPIVALDDFRTNPLIRTDHVTPVFRIELRCQLSRFY